VLGGGGGAQVGGALTLNDTQCGTGGGRGERCERWGSIVTVSVKQETVKIIYSDYGRKQPT
jgi:hypothetical protein